MIYKKIVLKKGQKIWFTSDTHFGHKNICRGTSSWDLSQHGGHDSVRDFDTLEQMNDTLVNDINKYVGQDDYLVHLGDWSFGGIENIWNFKSRINCRNIILILGNHDHHIANNRKLPNCRAKWGYPIEGTIYSDSYADSDIKALSQGMFESIHAYLELVVSSDKGKKTYNMMHFPLAVWNKGHHNRIMLHGHVHGSFQHPGRSLDVGVDKAFELFGEYRPFSQEDISRFMKNREFEKLSHHNKNTN